MKPLTFSFLLLLGTLAAMHAADTPAPARRPSRAPIVSPEIGADRQVTFRLRAPKASEVVVAGQWKNGRSAMTKDTNDVWSVTVGPIDPGVYEYSFQMDGVSMIDPANSAIKPMRQPATSILHLAGNPPLVHDWQEVPHGVLHTHGYFSKVVNRVREVVVYTPPGYGQQPERRFPTLYLQHGSGDNQSTWTVHGKAHWILDNLAAQKKAKPMVMVMMDGHAAWGDIPRSGPGSNSQLFERDLLEEVMPLVEANYRVLPEAANRALVGLSMGGEQALRIGLNHLDQFAWVGGFSAAIPANESMTGVLGNAAAANEKLKLLWIGCGKGDFLLKMNEGFIATLQEKNLRHEWHLTEGDHSWPIWRGYLADLAPRLFQ